MRSTPRSCRCRGASRREREPAGAPNGSGRADCSFRCVCTVHARITMNDMNDADSALLVCPRTRLPLRRLELADACRAVAPGRLVWPGAAGPLAATAPTHVLLRADGALAYPVVDGIPVLLAPEALIVAPGGAADGLQAEAAERRNRQSPAALAPRYAEAYAEMAHYNAVAAGHLRSLKHSWKRSSAAAAVAPALRAS